MGRHQAISRKGQSLWGKLAPDRSNYWLPLWLHLADTGEIAKLLWDHWLPEYTKMDIAAGLEIGSGQPQDMKVAYARKVAIFMAAIHDIGKASPVFVSKASKVGFGDIIDEITSRGLPVSAINPAQARDFPHGLVGECILEQQGWTAVLQSLLVVIMASRRIVRRQSAMRKYSHPLQVLV